MSAPKLNLKLMLAKAELLMKLSQLMAKACHMLELAGSDGMPEALAIEVMVDVSADHIAPGTLRDDGQPLDKANAMRQMFKIMKDLGQTVEIDGNIKLNMADPKIAALVLAHNLEVEQAEHVALMRGMIAEFREDPVAMMVSIHAGR